MARKKTAPAPEPEHEPEDDDLSPKTQPIMLRMSPAELDALDHLASELERRGHPALDALSNGLTRSALIRAELLEL
jgi:hypothetical protein